MIRHFTASGIVLSHDEQVLLIKHRKLGMWLYPGGHIEPNEDPVQAVLREVAGCGAGSGLRTPPEVPSLISKAAEYARRIG
ncbi:MAG: NUDIX domain-containing protein [Streptosporangiales bacterium]